MEGYIDITGANLRVLVKKAYELSSPQGLGFLHFTPGNDLPDAEVDEILGRRQVSMDYVRGRSIKMHVLEKDGKRFIRDRWYDHSLDQLQSLLTAIGVNATVTT